MAYEVIVLDISLVAAADLSASQYRFVKVDANGKAALAAAGENAIGVLQDKPVAGQTATVRLYGISKVMAGAAIAKGAAVASDANGKAKTAVSARTDTSDAGAANDPLIGSYAVGIALQAAAADGEIIPVALVHLGAIPQTVQ